MKLYHYPVLPGDCLGFPVRFQSQGLCNLLLPTLRAYQGSLIYGGSFVKPCFRQLDKKTVLLSARSRLYHSIARHRSASEMRSVFQALVVRTKIDEDHIYEILSHQPSLNINQATVFYEGCKSYFHSLNNKDTVLEFFRQILPEEISNNLPLQRNYDVSIHIRRGDFLERDYQTHFGMNTILPIGWYKLALLEASKILRKKRLNVAIFSDSTLTQNLSFEFSPHNLIYPKNQNTIAEIFDIASASIIICSRSTFSMMARQISDSFCIWDKYFDFAEFFLVSERDLFV